MNQITQEQVEHVANLARLNLSNRGKEKYTSQLNGILNFFEKLKHLDTTNVEPTSHVMDVYNVMREDEKSSIRYKRGSFKECTDQEEGHFKVPPVME